MVLLTAAIAIYLLTLVLQPASVALGRHRQTSIVWLVGAAAFGLTWVLPGGPVRAVSGGIAASSLVVVVGLALVIRGGIRRADAQRTA